MRSISLLGGCVSLLGLWGCQGTDDVGAVRAASLITGGLRGLHEECDLEHQCLPGLVCYTWAPGYARCELADYPPDPDPGPHAACESFQRECTNETEAWCCGANYTCGAAKNECDSGCPDDGHPCQGVANGCCAADQACEVDAETEVRRCAGLGLIFDTFTCGNNSCNYGWECIVENDGRGTCCAPGTFYKSWQGTPLCLPVGTEFCEGGELFCTPGTTCEWSEEYETMWCAPTPAA